MMSRSESKKRSCESLESQPRGSGKFWDGSNSGDQDQDLDDPRKDENWKIQKRKGFLKDRENKKYRDGKI